MSNGFPYSLTCEITFDPAFTASPTWVDVTDKLVSFSTFRGQQYDTDGPQPGTLTVTFDNTDGDFDPDNTSGPYYGSILPNRRIRIIAQQTAISTPVALAYAYVDSISRSWPGGMAYSETVFSCTDLTKYYARWTIAGATVTQQSINQHMNTAAGYACSTGGAGLTYEAAAYDGIQWDFIQALALADGGRFFIGTDGNPVYHTSAYRATQTVSTTSQATFAFGTPNGIACETDLAPTVDDRLLANSITVVDSAGTNRTASAGSSIAQYGTLAFSIDSRLAAGNGGLIATAANSRAAAIRAQRAYARSRVADFRLDALTDSDCMTQALTRQISDRVTLTVGGLGGGSVSTVDYFIESVAHDVQLQGSPSWVTNYQVSACTTAADYINLLTANQSTLENGNTTGWAAEQDPSYIPNVYTVLTADTTHAHGGTYSLKAGVSAATGRYFSTPSGTSGIPVTAGSTYALDGWVWRTDSSNLSRVQFDIRWYDISGTLLSTTEGYQYAPTRDMWVHLTYKTSASGGTADYVAPSGAEYAQLYCQCTSANSTLILFWFDDMLLKRL